MEHESERTTDPIPAAKDAEQLQRIESIVRKIFKELPAEETCQFRAEDYEPIEE